MTTRTTFIGGASQPVASGETAQYKCQLLDETGAAVPASALTALTLSIVDTATGAVVNGCSAADILNTGRGTVDAAGNLAITLTPADTALLAADDAQECRSLVIDWTYGDGSKIGRHQVDFLIVALGGA
ncbi:MAG TPA: hypothetical protein VMU42_02645 [Candidatus Sulfotelmatobacter sp.]|nr:hypothetical protein [Candidatus Sulfotelmatobacter sp.]